EARVLEGAGRLPRRGVLLPDEQVRLAERAIGEGQVRIAAARGLEQLEALPRPARARDPQDPARAQELRRLAPARALARALLVPPGLELPGGGVDLGRRRVDVGVRGPVLPRGLDPADRLDRVSSLRLEARAQEQVLAAESLALALEAGE